MDRAVKYSGLSLQPLLDRITSLTGDNVPLECDLAEQDARIAVLEEELHSATAATVSQSDRFRAFPTSNGSASQTKI